VVEGERETDMGIIVEPSGLIVLQYQKETNSIIGRGFVDYTLVELYQMTTVYYILL